MKDNGQLLIIELREGGDGRCWGLMGLEGASVMLVMAGRMTTRSGQGGTGDREEGGTEEADRIGQKERRSC